MTRSLLLLMGCVILAGCSGSKPPATELLIDVIADRNFDEEAENKAIEQVQKLGGSCYRAKPGQAVNEITFKNVKLTDDDLAVLKAFAKLTGLTIQDCTGFTGTGFEHLAKTPKLTFLQLTGGTITSKAFQGLVHAPHLRFLTLVRVQFSVEDAQQLTTLKELQTIELLEIPLTELHLKPLGALPELMELMLHETGLTKEVAQTFADRINENRPKEKPRLGISF